ncbi:MAG TPA: hypothetical protein IAC66_02045 [Candidatus Aphodousia gallistercoris]|nr:hypothetical protein [Candidatus Aphodousia gallistercoris]
MVSSKPSQPTPCWLKPDGTPVSCTEKVMVLNENYAELKALIKDALEDALVLGCSEQQVRQSFHDLIDSIQTDIKEDQVHP